MSRISTYTQAFREQALEKVYNRGQRTISEVADELNMKQGTLKGWMKTSKQQVSANMASTSKRPNDWSSAQRLQALREIHGMNEEESNAYCREKGVFPHQLEQWKKAFENSPDESHASSVIRDLKSKNQSLNKELQRKEKALAEAAALLVLQKKFQAFWVDKES